MYLRLGRAFDIALEVVGNNAHVYTLQSLIPELMSLSIRKLSPPYRANSSYIAFDLSMGTVHYRRDIPGTYMAILEFCVRRRPLAFLTLDRGRLLAYYWLVDGVFLRVILRTEVVRALTEDSGPETSAEVASHQYGRGPETFIKPNALVKVYTLGRGITSRNFFSRTPHLTTTIATAEDGLYFSKYCLLLQSSVYSQFPGGGYNIAWRTPSPWESQHHTTRVL